MESNPRVNCGVVKSGVKLYPEFFKFLTADKNYRRIQSYNLVVIIFLRLFKTVIGPTFLYSSSRCNVTGPNNPASINGVLPMLSANRKTSWVLLKRFSLGWLRSPMTRFAQRLMMSISNTLPVGF